MGEIIQDKVMNSNQLFEMALQLQNGWKVVGSEFSGDPKKLQLRLDFEKGTQFACPECGGHHSSYDTDTKKWRHLNFWQYETELEARVPRIECQKCGVKTVEVPWARAGSGFTLMFEAFAMLMMERMSVKEVAELIKETDTRLWRILIHHVNHAHARENWKKVRAVLVDETSARRGHRYVTLFVDADSGTLLFMAEGKASDTILEFSKALRLHQASAGQIEWLGMDMSKAFLKGAREYFPKAQIVLDRFHVMQLIGKVQDEVRMAIHRQTGNLKNARWALAGNEWTRTEEQQELRRQLCAQYPRLAKVMELRDILQAAYETKDVPLLEWWLRKACRTPIDGIKRLAKTLREHWDGILGYFKSGITSATIEAINGKIQLAKRAARGFRNFHYMQAIAYLKAAKLDFQLPTL